MMPISSPSSRQYYVKKAPTMPRRSLLSGFAAILIVVGFGASCRRTPPMAVKPAEVRVTAAADLSLAFTEIGQLYEQRTGQKVTFSFGSTGMAAKQLREGAPFDLFAAANVSYVDEVVSAGACDGATKAPYARGRVAVWTKQGGVAHPRAFTDLAGARFKRIAIANPEHAPYGKAARQALEGAGIFSAVESRLVLGENVRQTLQFAESGNVDAAIVALSIIIKDDVNTWTIIDESLHQPIEQALVVCNRGKNRDGGHAFARFVNSEAGRTIMRRYGFLLPGERVASSR